MFNKNPISPNLYGEIHIENVKKPNRVGESSTKIQFRQTCMAKVVFWPLKNQVSPNLYGEIHIENVKKPNMFGEMRKKIQFRQTCMAKFNQGSYLGREGSRCPKVKLTSTGIRIYIGVPISKTEGQRSQTTRSRDTDTLRQRQPKTRTTTSHLALLPGYLAWERGQVKRHGA